MPHLFEPIAFRGLGLPHRIIVSPMCQYSSVDGFATDWHLVHLGSRAIGGAALVFTEATAVTPEGRISPQDLGIWSDDHIRELTRITHFIRSQGAAAGIQLAHAGRKGSTTPPWMGIRAVPVPAGGWTPVAPSATPFAETYPAPRALDVSEIPGVVESFRAAARRALRAGFDVIELHAAHGYLIHQFLSPLVNARTDAYGGSFQNRIRFCLEVVDAIRSVWPAEKPLFVRISSTDWTDAGWTLDDSVGLAKRLRDRGVDLIDCSSGGTVPDATIPLSPGYQVPFAERIRRDVGIATGAVGLITDAKQADDIVRAGQADCVLLARQMLRDPYWPLHAAEALGHTMSWPVQYLRAAHRDTPSRIALSAIG